ncbi:MAG: hypothetical protein ABIN91_02510 [Mucilaginibacter sp.]|uniref:hypothetical protein n=1 Tax=Mucilaginibacter sp. TaxID=1882438 RepID=UPI003265DBF5
MEIVIIKIVLLLCLIIIPLKGPAKRKDTNNTLTENSKPISSYGINEDGFLELINKNDTV